MGIEHRRHNRYPVDLPIVVLEGKNAVGMAVKNVSFDGMLLETTTPPELRKLLRLELLLPSDGETVRLTAMAVHLGDGPGDGIRHVGIQFFGLEPRTRQRWDRFIVDLRGGQPKTADTPAAPASSGAPAAPASSGAPASSAAPSPEPPRTPPATPRVLEAAPPELRIALDSSDAVDAVRREVVSKHELLIRTDIRIGLGRPVWVTFVHPATARSISLPAKVRMQHAEPNFVGLAVRIQLDESEREAFDDFTQDGVSVTIDFESTDIMGLEDMEGRARAPLSPSPERPPGMIA